MAAFGLAHWRIKELGSRKKGGLLSLEEARRTKDIIDQYGRLSCRGKTVVRKTSGFGRDGLDARQRKNEYLTGALGNQHTTIIVIVIILFAIILNLIILQREPEILSLYCSM